ncbi:fibronectin type III domain-containing protein [Streptomyces sp. TLI_053]|uniref:fibronectin type III domain-containing protein n=1 Tax=Streptomyces sp. TLI_053 TaxID=1855352 RepID=UPI000D1BB4BA|nr:fibronectin type III domain-containing protein [Streptomyces sp. TLI_053]
MLTLLVSLALVLGTVTGSASAQGAGTRDSAAAAAALCGTHATSFSTPGEEGAPMTARLGCAKDAGGLRALAANDDDLVLAFDFPAAGRRQQARDLTAAVVAETRADQDAGMSLGAAFTQRAREHGVGIYPTQQGSAEFRGTVHAVDDSLVVVTPMDVIGFEETWWQKFIASGVGVAVSILVGAGCLVTFGPGAPAAAPVCGAVSGALGSLTTEILNAAFDGKSVADGTVWADAVAASVWPAVAGAFGGALLNWAASSGPTAIAELQTALRNFGTKLGNLGNTLGFMANALNPFAPRLLDSLRRLQRGVGNSSVPLRVLVVGDSMTQGMEGDWTWRYRLWEWFRNQHVAVDFVGPYRGTKQPDAPNGPPGPPPLQGEIENPSAVPPPVDGAYAQGVPAGFDSDHFAVWGRQAAQDKDLIGPVVAQYRPDLVLFGIGFNDMGWLVSDAPGTLESVKAMVDRARAAKPDLRFAVANVPMRPLIEGRQDLIVKTRQYNTLLAKAIPSWSTPASPVEPVDWEGAYSCDTNTCPAAYDNLHPNALGEFQIASAFERTLHDGYGIGQFVPSIPGTVPRRPVLPVNSVVAESAPSGVKVTWTPVFGARGYTVRYRLAGLTEWNEARVWTNRYDTTWTEDGWTWEYQVRTDNDGDGESVWSGTVTATAHPETAAPPRNIVTRATATGVDVSWDAATGPHTDGIDRYQIITWDRDVPGAYIGGTAVRGTSVHIDGLVPGHHYLVALVTWNRAGGGMPGVARSVTIGAGVPPVPANLRIASVDPTTVQLNWQGSPEAAGYRVWVRNVSDHSPVSPEPYVTDTPDHRIAFLFPGNWNYEFCVTAINGASESARTPCVSVPLPPPSTGTAQLPSAGGESPTAPEDLLVRRGQLADPRRDLVAAAPAG